MAQQSRFGAKLIPLALAIILTLMTVFGVGGAIITTKANEAVNQALFLSDHYEQARYWIGAEESLERKYRLEPGPEVYQMHRAAAAQLQANLQQIAQQGSAADKQIVQHALALHVAYLTDTAAMFVAVDANDLARVVQIDHTVVDPVFTEIATTVDAQADYYHGVAAHRSQDLLHVQEWVVWLTPIVYLSGIVFLVFLWRVFLGYQRALHETREREVSRLEQAALTDNLTGLGNHRAYQEEVHRELLRSNRHSLPMSLALIDIDEFKSLNDTHGHAFGDQVLRTMGTLLQSLIGTGRAYRVGGDEFALMLPHVAQPQAYTLLESIRQTAQQQLTGATLSIGLTSLKPAESNAEDLREEADAALYEAKRRGRNTLVLFDEVRDSVSLVSAKKIQALRDLLAEETIEIVFQPIWDVYQQKMLAVEALSRPDEKFGLAGPQEAFDVAERIGHEAELDLICIQAILRQSHCVPPEVLLFVNLCPRSLRHPQLQAESLAKLVREAGVQPQQIVIEITERAITHIELLAQEVLAFRAQGFKIALDDTGAGNSGLELLTHLRVDFVKIDRGILVRAMQDKTARGVLAGIVAIARETGSHIIAEGIEDTAMLDLVMTLGTRNAQHLILGVQGYLMGKPNVSIPTDYPLLETSLLEKAA
jgi:diguanylate cyclase (GGDEF)-like protein